MQIEFCFDEKQPPAPSGESDGLAGWREELRRQHLDLAKKLGLPLDHAAEVWLKNGICLKGILRLDEEMLLHVAPTHANIRFIIDRAPFQYSEIERCIRL
jgi:hypothetical protein